MSLWFPRVSTKQHTGEKWKWVSYWTGVGRAICGRVRLTSGGGSSKNEFIALSISQLHRSRTSLAWKSLQPVIAETCCTKAASSLIVACFAAHAKGLDVTRPVRSLPVSLIDAGAGLPYLTPLPARALLTGLNKITIEAAGYQGRGRQCRSSHLCGCTVQHFECGVWHLRQPLWFPAELARNPLSSRFLKCLPDFCIPQTPLTPSPTQPTTPRLLLDRAQIRAKLPRLSSVIKSWKPCVRHRLTCSRSSHFPLRHFLRCASRPRLLRPKPAPSKQHRLAQGQQL